MKKTIHTLSTLLLAFAMSCGSDSDVNKAEANITHFKGTQSPGDVWDWALNHDENTFSTVWDYGTFDDETDDITIEGTFTTLGSGYLKATITEVTPPNADIPDDGSAWFYAMHLPNVAMIVKPEGSIKGDMISTVAAGDCADVIGEYNYIMIAPGNGEVYDPYTEEAYGVAVFIEDGDGFGIHGDKYSLDCANGGPCTVNTGITGLPTAECAENGTISISSDENETLIEGQFTGAGVMMLDLGLGNGGVLAAKRNTAFTLADLDNEEFIGFAYLPANNNDKTVPVNLTWSNDGTGVGKAMTNITTGELASDGVVFEVTGISNGLANGTLTHADESVTTFVAAMIESEGSKIIIGSSFDQDGNAFILVLVSK